jgi:hypothetical protein
MVAITTEQRRTAEISAEERELRIQLAAAYHLADKYGMSELIYTHISLRVPGIARTPPTGSEARSCVRFTTCAPQF